MISVITTVMNREPSLCIALASWLLHPEITEVLIVDWSSRVSLNKLVGLDRRITVIRVDGETRFHKAAALNLAIDHVRGDRVLQLDAEYVLNPHCRLFDQVKLAPGEFVSGDQAWKETNVFYAGLTGFLYAWTADVRAVNGFNELIHGWGREDLDLYRRLRDSGLRERSVPYDDKLVFHIPHPGELRVANYDCKDYEQSNAHNKALSAENRYTARLIAWDCEHDVQWIKATRRPV